MSKARFLKSLLRLIAETVVMSVVGSIFLSAVSTGVVITFADGTYEPASRLDTFTHYAMNVCMLYLMYRLVYWLLSMVVSKTSRTVDSGLADVAVYSTIRDRVADVFQDGVPESADPSWSQTTGWSAGGVGGASSQASPPAPASTSGDALSSGDRCPHCNVRGDVHLSGCPRFGRYN